MMRSALVAALFSLPACGTTGVAGPGRLDATLVKSGATLEGAEKYELRADGTGALEKISLYHKSEARVPEAVRKLVQAQLPGAKIKKYELEMYADGKLSHEVEVDTSDGRECEVSATESGELRYVECDVKAADLPDAVAKAVAAKLPGGEITEAETKKGPGLDVIAVDVKLAGRTHELHLKPNGEIVSHHLSLPAVVEIPAE